MCRRRERVKVRNLSVVILGLVPRICNGLLSFT